MEKKFPKASDYGKKIVFYIIALSLLIALIVLISASCSARKSHCSSSKSVSMLQKSRLNICPGVEDIYVASGNKKKIRLYPCWTGVIGTEMGKHRVVTASGDFERCLWDREREICSAITSGNNHHYREYGVVDTNLLRLRSLQDGENYATITVD